MFRFAGLPNNTNLEMVEVDTKRVEQDLVICLQLEDNTRINGNFPSSATLKEVITTLCPEKSAKEQSPVVIYMRSELFGDALEATTLKSLGLSSGGRALIRLLNTDPQKLKVQANVSAPLPQKPKEEVPEIVKTTTAQVGSKPGTSDLFQFTDVKMLKQQEPEKPVDEPMEIAEEEPEAIAPKTDVVNVPHAKAEMPDEPIEQDIPNEPEPVINILDERGTIVFSLDTMQTSSVDLPDTFFELTEGEVRKLYRDLQRQSEHNCNRPLMTSALRKLEENKKILNQLTIYKSTAIRIQFPNRYVIQSKVILIYLGLKNSLQVSFILVLDGWDDRRCDGVCSKVPCHSRSALSLV